jgi:DNA ligase (NAD+)
MEGVGREWVVKFWQEGLIEDAADLFAISEKDLAPLERMGGKLSRNLIEAIQSRKRLPLSVLLRALGLPGVGDALAKSLARYFGSWDQLSRATEAELQAMEGIGPVLAHNISQWLGSKQIQNFVAKLRRNGVEILPESGAEESSGAASRPLQGKKVLFTGSLSLVRDRAKELVEDAGGKVVSSLSKNTDYLVVGENPGSKYQKALDLKVTVLHEDEFRNLVEGQ